MGKRLNLENTKIGYLKVLNLNKIENGEVFWNCICDCGQKFIRSRRSLLNKNNIDKSCGCIKNKKSKERLLKIIKNNTKDFGIAEKNRVIRSYKYSARTRKLDWNLSDDQATKLFLSKCQYCNAPPSNICCNLKTNTYFKYNGIDRIDNTLGYTKENSISCCIICNNAKKDLSIKDFLDWINRFKQQTNIIKPFFLYRKEDVSGTSGTGIVAIGVILKSGKCIIEWLGKFTTETIFDNIEQVEKIHGHDGKTEIVFGEPPLNLLT